MNSSTFFRILRVHQPALKGFLKHSSNTASPVLTKRFTSIRPITKRLFSSNNLSDILDRELAEEKEKGSMLPDDLQELKETISKDWTIVNDNESGTVKLFRKDGPQKVAIAFHCQDTLNEEDFIDPDEEDEEETSPEVRFTLTVSKAGKTMVLSCVSLDANALIESVVITPDDGELVNDLGKVNDKLYQGPQFDELAENLQDAFTAFVQEECGITSDVAAFISMFADFKEQQEYIRWLQQVQSIL